ncbi:MAG: sialidase family protein [Victivallales bacterium]
MRSKLIVMDKSRTKELWLGIPGIERTKRGRLIVVWFSGGDKEPHEENRIYMQTSDDDGVSFSDPEIVIEKPGVTRVYDPSLWFDPQGVLWMIYNQSNMETQKHCVCAIQCADADAGKLKWSKERILGFDVDHSFNMNKPLVLQNGDWLMPVTWYPEPVKWWFTVGAELQGAGISADQGRTWKLYGDVKAPDWALEGMFMERADGTVVMYIRSGGGRISQSISKDHGRTWSASESTEIVNPGSRFFIRKMPSGKWLLINTPVANERKSMYAYLSGDEGRTWSKGLLLDERAGVSYPDAAITEDGTVYAVYDRDRYGALEILMAVFTEKDII